MNKNEKVFIVRRFEDVFFIVSDSIENAIFNFVKQTYTTTEEIVINMTNTDFSEEVRHEGNISGDNWFNVYFLLTPIENKPKDALTDSDFLTDNYTIYPRGEFGINKVY